MLYLIAGTNGEGRILSKQQNKLQGGGTTTTTLPAGMAGGGRDLTAQHIEGK